MDDRTLPAGWSPGSGPGSDDRTLPAVWRPSSSPGADDRTRPADRRTTSASGEWGPRRFQPGVQVGEFVLEQRLGQGGMGAVFVARRRDGELRVALKVLLVEQGDMREDELERFRREGQAQAAVDAHPNVLRVITQGTHEGYPYLVTELASGGDLKGRLKQGPMEPRAAARLAAALARGLAHVHARGVLHRDLKPGNVVFGEDDAPKLMDFGLARLAEARKLTQTGATLGTAAYMAPEQAAGERVDERADVYGLGAILYECLVGRAPFEGTSDVGIIKQVLTDEVEPPRALRPEVPVDLEAVVLRALAHARMNRYPSAAALAEDLERFVAGKPVSARAPAGGRRGVLVAAVGLALLVAAGGAAVAASRRGAAPASGAEAHVAPAATFLGLSAGEGAGGRWHLVEAGATSLPLRVRSRGGVRLRSTHLAVGARVDERPRRAPAIELVVPPGDDVALAAPVQAGWQTLELVAADARSTTPPLDVLSVVVLPDALRLAPDAGPLAAVGREGSVLLLVTPGTFEFVGVADARRRPGAPLEPREVRAPYFLGRTEVSWAQVERFDEARGEGRRRPTLPLAGAPPFEPPDDHPVAYIQPWQAEEYCVAHGLRLPTDLEWEYAAQGVSNGNHDGDADGFLHTAPVGQVVGAVGRWGHLHLRGNLWEFVQRSPGQDLAVNYGSAWNRGGERFRAEDSLEFASENTGFRVALGLDAAERPVRSYPLPR